jgi:6-pyruvoyl-tetrahydropterin synthase
MFCVEVRDHIMVAHSFASPVFGPAQALHGATFVVDAGFFATDLDATGLVVDIARATDELKAVLDPLRYQNLDALPAFAGRFTTTEFLAKHVFDGLAEAVRAGRLNDGGRVRRLRVELHESHVARASYEADL